jgi:YidC/Oxa1 family membrane protein insertase
MSQRLFVLALAVGALGGLWLDAGIASAALQPPSLQVIEREGYQEILVRTKLAEYLFSARGGTLRSAYLYFAPIGTQPVELIPDTESRFEPATKRLERSYVKGARFPFALSVGDTPTDELVYEVRPERFDDRLVLTFTAIINGLRVTKTFIITENPYYTLEVRVRLENTSGETIDVAALGGARLFLGRGVGRSPDLETQSRYLFGDQVTDRPLEAADSERSEEQEDPQSGRTYFQGLGFVGGGLVFFLKTLTADGALEPLASIDAGAGLGVELAPVTLPPGAAITHDFELYAGREKYTLLRHVGLGQLSPPGFFSQFLIPVVELLDWLYRVTGNYGWAIILFTIITRILLFPLTRKQFHSMAKMAELRPKLEKLQQRYPTLARLKKLHPNLSEEELMKRDRENRRALQEKMMELYREEGINPLGGCLPMLIQFPILIILWRAILYSAETIHLSPGFLWMSDLSSKDPYYLIVALTALAMVLQTKTTPMMTTSGQGPNPMVMMLFSVGLMVLFLKDFPAGLWLYYFLTTVIQVGQQVFIKWELNRLKLQKMGAEEEAPVSEKPADPVS